MRKNFVRNLMFCMLLGSVCAFSAGCGGEAESLSFFPVASLPEELKETFPENLQVENTVVRSNAVPDDLAAKTNEILMQNRFEVCFDSTTGCFMEYANLHETNPQDDAYQIFAKTMKSFRDTFESAKAYQTYALQADPADSERNLNWFVFPENVFMNFNQISTYAKGKGKILEGTCPMSMWLDQVQTGLASDTDDTVYVYISDLNEQNGLLSTCGKQLKAMLDANAEMDMLLMSYSLEFKGTIHLPTAEIEGNDADQTQSKTFDDYVDRQYYLVALGDRVALQALCNSVNQNFKEVNLTTQVFMYRDFCYTEQEKAARMADGTPAEPDFLKKFPPEFSVLDSAGNVIGEEAPPQPEETPAPPAEDDLLGGRKEDAGLTGGNPSGTPLANLELCSDPAVLFSEPATGSVYAYRNLVPSMGSRDAEIAFRLENSSVYHLDTNAMKLYVYQPATAADDLQGGGQEGGWIASDAASLADMKISVSAEEESVRIRLEDSLANTRTPVLAVSIPVTAAYTQENTEKKIQTVSEEFQNLIRTCQVPVPGNDVETYTKTYDFDSFMDKLTGYKAILDSGQNPLEELTSKPETAEFLDTVDRLNIIISADERNS